MNIDLSEVTFQAKKLVSLEKKKFIIQIYVLFNEFFHQDFCSVWGNLPKEKPRAWAKLHPNKKTKTNLEPAAGRPKKKKIKYL